MHIKLHVHRELSGEAREELRVRRDSQTYLTTEPFFSPFGKLFSLTTTGLAPGQRSETQSYLDSVVQTVYIFHIFPGPS